MNLPQTNVVPTLTVHVHAHGLLRRRHRRVSADAVASRTLGDGSADEGPEDTTHGVTLRNESDRTWTARLLVDGDAGPLFDGVYTVAPGGRVRLTLAERGTNSVSFDVLETGGTATEAVPSSSFDCNESSTRATIDAEANCP
ncbi:hypothetical protein [Halomicrobium mukohataei]|uniref:Uncharacterized protein n=1 Tax=Halomicrobium mukohataei TaxID=57705 RepID=A0A4D6KG32_9EURY|nr:hypothetical protein [Halomicrobium mukohataei]QCD67170.1 hypothetical protein E5139_16040 [Halomicrobium mukohataei]